MSDYNFSLDLETKNTISVTISWLKDSGCSPCRVLEFGPANGRLTRYLKETLGCNVTIVEIDETAGSEAAQYAEKAYLGETEGDIEKYLWAQEEAVFDRIILNDVLEHLHDPKRVLEECRKHLAENGEIIVSIPNVAHNSILVGLCLGRFDYDSTGLLDRTHVHFFTYATFTELLKEAELTVYETQLIYSKVGNNEIANTYEDLPSSVSRYLRSRWEGSVYQYLFRIGTDSAKENSEVPWEEIDRYEDEESTVIPMTALNELPEAAQKVSCIYTAGSSCDLSFRIANETEKPFCCFRWDPLEHSCMFILEECFLRYPDGTRQELFVHHCNADLKIDNLFAFYEEDPWIYFKPDSAAGFQGGPFELVASFTLLATGLNSEQDAREFLRAAVLADLSASRQKETVTKLETRLAYLERKPLADQISELNSVVEQRNRDIEELHEELGNEIRQLHQDVAHRDQDIQKLNTEISNIRILLEKSEQDILEQKAEIEKRDSQIEEQGAFIAKKEQDISELKTYIEKKEQDILKLRAYIEKMNKSIPHFLKNRKS